MKDKMIEVVNFLKERVGSNLNAIRENEKEIRKLLKQPVSPERTQSLEIFFSHNRQMLDENKDALSIELGILNYLRKFGELKENLKYSGGESDGSSTDYFEELEDEIVEQTEASFEVEDEEDDENSFKASLEYDRKVFFDYTINGKLVYNDRHLFWEDEGFYNDLMEHYKQLENYERCAELIKSRPAKTK
ncbi:MAG TPA: hypothetical protein VMV56_12480 [Williamwhitmania sp.]|nr:hypothetical protein [Williamwhitmania sp.]